MYVMSSMKSRLHSKVRYLSDTIGTLITTKIKSRFLNNSVFQINHVVVVTENGVVYLTGMVKRAEENKAAELASGISGVNKMATVFEHLD